MSSSARSLSLVGALLAATSLAACAHGGAATGGSGSPEPLPQQAPPPQPQPTGSALALPTVPPPAPAGVTVATPSSVADLVETVAPTVVNITAIQQGRTVQGSMPLDPFEFFFGQPGGSGTRPQIQLPPQQAAGTGFIIDAQGHVVTNEHVVRGADEVKVRLLDEREFRADVVGRDPKLDVALLKLRGASNLPLAALGSSSVLRVGEQVLAVGNPFGLGHTVTMGIVSAKARSIGAGPYDDFIQTDTAINPGNSGGPLFNLRGEVVGINTVIRGGAEGIGFAIPIDAVKEALGQLQQKGFVERGKLGLAFQPIDDDLGKALGLAQPLGALVTEVEKGSAADRAGLREGDVIVSVGGVPIRHSEELARNVARNPPGATVEIGVQRKGQPLRLKATLDKLDDEDAQTPPPRHGAGPATPTQQLAGVEVDDAPGGGGARVVGLSAGRRGSGLQPGDVVQQVGSTPIRNAGEFRKAIEQLPQDASALLKVRRGKRTLFIGMPVKG